MVVGLAAGCAPCELQSTYPSFDPVCDQAVLRRYTTEARLAISSPDGVLVAYLPHDIHAGERYGGNSGNSLTVILEDELASTRKTTLTLHELDSAQATGEILAYFDAGDVLGTFVAAVERGD